MHPASKQSCQASKPQNLGPTPHQQADNPHLFMVTASWRRMCHAPLLSLAGGSLHTQTAGAEASITATRTGQNCTRRHAWSLHPKQPCQLQPSAHQSQMLCSPSSSLWVWRKDCRTQGMQHAAACLISVVSLCTERRPHRRASQRCRATTVACSTARARR